MNYDWSCCRPDWPHWVAWRIHSALKSRCLTNQIRAWRELIRPLLSPELIFRLYNLLLFCFCVVGKFIGLIINNDNLYNRESCRLMLLLAPRSLRRHHRGVLFVNLIILSVIYCWYLLLTLCMVVVANLIQFGRDEENTRFSSLVATLFYLYANNPVR